MKAYTEPKLEIVTLNASDVITASSGILSLMRSDSNIEAGSIESFAIGNN